MTNKELQEILKQYPDDAEIIRERTFHCMNSSWDAHEFVSQSYSPRFKFGEFKDVNGSPIRGLLVDI